MSKDPAVLFYTKDWLEGTVDMFPEEKGVYIDLLCYQHQKGFLPKNEQRLAKITGISEERFSNIWQEIKHKFVTIDSLDTSLSEALSDWKNTNCASGYGDAYINIRMLLETITRRKLTSNKSIQAYVANWFRYESLGKSLKKSNKTKLLKMIDYEKLRIQNSGKKEIYSYLENLTKRIAQQSYIANANVNVNVKTINEINSAASENANAKPLEIAKIADQEFQKKLFDFFSMKTDFQNQIVLKKLIELKNKNILAEFTAQTEAYMRYKTSSNERKHGWNSYQAIWQQTDWKHKLSQLPEIKQTNRKKFSINR